MSPLRTSLEILEVEPLEVVMEPPRAESEETILDEDTPMDSDACACPCVGNCCCCSS